MDAEPIPKNRPVRYRPTRKINGLHHDVRPNESRAGDVSGAFRLGRKDEVFDIVRNIHGPI